MKKAEPGLSYIRTVCDYTDVFSEELSGLPPKREIEFATDDVPGATQASITSYRMTPVKLEELKFQLQELLEKGFIRSSVSTWGAPVTPPKLGGPLTTRQPAEDSWMSSNPTPHRRVPFSRTHDLMKIGQSLLYTRSFTQTTTCTKKKT